MIVSMFTGYIYLKESGRTSPFGLNKSHVISHSKLSFFLIRTISAIIIGEIFYLVRYLFH